MQCISLLMFIITVLVSDAMYITVNVYYNHVSVRCNVYHC